MIQGIVSRELGQIMIVAISITMLLSPLLASLANIVSRRITHGANIGYEKAQESGISLDGHVIVAGYGRVGRTIGTRLGSQQISFVGVDLDPDRVKVARQSGEPVYFGDATRPEVLDALNVVGARAVVVALANPESALRLVGLLHYLFPELPIFARAQDDEHAKSLEKAGALVVIPELIATGDRLASAILNGSN